LHPSKTKIIANTALRLSKQFTLGIEDIKGMLDQVIFRAKHLSSEQKTSLTVGDYVGLPVKKDHQYEKWPSEKGCFAAHSSGIERMERLVKSHHR